MKKKNLHHTCVLIHIQYRQRLIVITGKVKPLTVHKYIFDNTLSVSEIMKKVRAKNIAKAAQ